MAHYALLNEDNIVVYVMTGEKYPAENRTNEEWEQHYLALHGEQFGAVDCKRTRYGAGAKRSGEPFFRGNFAGLGFIYMPEHDIFIDPKPRDYMLLNVEKACWDYPIPYPETVEGEEPKNYYWSEEVMNWVEAPEDDVVDVEFSEGNSDTPPS